jgi:hypothetical protein
MGFLLDKERNSMRLNLMTTYGGITAINRSPSTLGLKPNGEATMALSNFLMVCVKQAPPLK